MKYREIDKEELLRLLKPEGLNGQLRSKVEVQQPSCNPLIPAAQPVEVERKMFVVVCVVDLMKR